jgi:hypothetical protein
MVIYDVIKGKKRDHNFIENKENIIENDLKEVDENNEFEEKIEKSVNEENEEEIINIFELFLRENNIIKKLDIGTYIIWNSYDQNHIDAVYEEILKICNDRRYGNKIRSNAIDILLRSNNKKYMDNSVVLLERLRQEERNQENVNDIRKIRKQINNLQSYVHPVYSEDENDIELQQVLMEQIRNLQMRENDIIVNQNRKASVYNDTQNVHNSEINDSVINIATSLINNKSSPSDMFNIDEELQKYYSDYENHKEQINTSLERIRNDKSKFKDGVTISMVFDKIIGIIANSIHKPELIKRLGEELYEMNGLCSTGHMARIVNVIQGFNDIPEELKLGDCKCGPEEACQKCMDAKSLV